MTPSFSITAIERILPNLDLDFTSGNLDSRITFTRTGNTATVINSSGVIQLVSADTPRFQHNPTTLKRQGLLIEQTRTNLLLNSLIDGTALATQTVSVTAAAHTLSFYGAGEIVLSGAHSATVTGNGAYPARKTYTFTPTAGNLTLTVSGTVQFSNLELGSFETSFIPTDGSIKTRNSDVALINGANFTSWFNQTEGTAACEFILGTDPTFVTGLFSLSSNTQNWMTIRNGTYLFGFVLASNATQAAIQMSALTSKDATYNGVLAYKENNFNAASNGTVQGSDALGVIPVCNSLYIGSIAGNNVTSSVIKRFRYWPQRVINAQSLALSK